MEIAYLLSISLLLVTFTAWFLLRASGQPKLRSVAILVLGDIGRSPRMMYHAESFAHAEFETNLIGYGGNITFATLGALFHLKGLTGSTPIASLLTLPNIRILHLASPPRLVTLLPFILGAPLKLLHQIFTILKVLLWQISAPEFILVQVYK